MIGWTATATAASSPTATCNFSRPSEAKLEEAYVSMLSPNAPSNARNDRRALPRIVLHPTRNQIMTDANSALADDAAQLILKRTPLRPRIGLVLGSGLGAFADSLTDAAAHPLRRHSRLPAIHRHRPRRTNGHRQRRQRSGRRHARPRPSLRRLFRAGSHLSHARLRTHGHPRRHPHQRRRRHQPRLPAGRARR